VFGTAEPSRQIVLHGKDRRHGFHSLGATTSSAAGTWSVLLPHGVLYNTRLQASSGDEVSNRARLNVHQVLRIDNRNGHCRPSTGRHCAISFAGEQPNGFHYVLEGFSRSRIPHESISVSFKGSVVGSTRMQSDGTFSVEFVLPHKTTHKLALTGTGRSSRGVRYTLLGYRGFRIHS
jgi:hypothetical protein